MGASQLAETCRVYCFSNTSVDTKILPTFQYRVAPVFFKVKIFALKKTRETQLKCRQDFRIHAGIEENPK